MLECFMYQFKNILLKKRVVNLHLVDYMQSTKHPSVETKSAVLIACFPSPLRGYQRFAATAQLPTRRAAVKARSILMHGALQP